jgi:CRISPR-associated protein Cas1
MRDLHELPKFRDGLSYLYLEHCRVDKKYHAVEAVDQEGRTLIPAAALAVLMLGPGTSVTHAAIKTLADNGCSIVWTGQDGTRLYAQGTGETRRAHQLLHQAELSSNPQKRLQVVLRMYRHRFGEVLPPGLDIEQVRGMEGARIRQAYREASECYGVRWSGRNYDRGSWQNTDPINRALSTANGLLNGLCHAAIVSAGYSPALGFIHTGKQLSFVYDIADLYKVEVTIPLAFHTVAESSGRLGTRVRAACRQAFKEHRLLKRILPDIESLLDVPDHLLQAGAELDADPALPEPLWSPSDEQIEAQATPAGSELEPTACPTDESAVARDQRRQRAQDGIEGDWTVRCYAPRVWRVITRADHAGYIVRQVDGTWQCECPDFARNGLGMCKHTAAVELVRARESGE